MHDVEFISGHLDLLDRWEERRLRRLERESRERIVVDARGVATVERTPEDEFDREIRLQHRGMKVRLLWELRYSETVRDAQGPNLYAWDYVSVVIDHRLGLRKTLSVPRHKRTDKSLRRMIREQVDGIIAALDDIERMTEQGGS